MIRLLSGNNNQPIGLRPGGGYYSDSTPREMIAKAVDVALEAESVRKTGMVSQVCYESENCPRISLKKPPEATMIECALMLACGQDSISLYYHSSRKIYPGYARKTVEYRPYFELLAKNSLESHLVGIYRLHGEDFLNRPTAKENENFSYLRDQDGVVYDLLSCGFPVAVTQEFGLVQMVTGCTVNSLSPDQIDCAIERKNPD